MVLPKTSLAHKKVKLKHDLDEIPIALREYSIAQRPRPWLPWALLGGFLGLGGVGIIGLYLILNQTSQPVANVQASSPGSAVAAANEEQNSATQGENILGHLPYQEAPVAELEAISPDGHLRLRHTAASKFREMVAAARADGVLISTISAYRSISEQEYLFFGVKEKRHQNTTKRAEVSAPPGYSEHHTGYAVDLGDGRVPALNLHPDFDQTAAYHWLEKNASRYSFELSFPKNNPQGISYEPWHWRFVGDIDSLKTFYRAQKLARPGINSVPLGNPQEPGEQ